MDKSISPELERRIAEQAEAAGYWSAEAFLRAILSDARLRSDVKAPSDTEFFRLLDELASDEDLPALPADFSRADIYADHD